MLYAKNHQIIIKRIAVALLAAGLLALLLCLYQSCVISNGHLTNMKIDSFGIGSYGAYFTFFSAISLFCVLLGKERLFRYRYLIAMICFAICVSLEITGSSIGLYAGNEEKNLLLGVSRHIRSDEWVILTPMTWTQYLDPAGAFSYYNSVIRAEATDVFLEYGLPIATPLMIYKPFLLGYLFLPIAKGMAFFWCGRLIALAMVSFEFGRLITDDKRLFSVVYSVMIAFSPIVQWWFAINGFVEMLIFFQLSIICFDRHLKDNNPWMRLLYTVVIGICAGGYALTMYPAWMIPLAYVLLGCIIWIYLRNRSQKNIRKLSKTDLLSILSVVTVLIISAVYIYNRSHETISTLMNTEYPGHRYHNGGFTVPAYLFSFIPSLWYAVRDGLWGVYDNVCECAYFICLFPAGFLLYLYQVIKKKRDALCTIMLIISILLMIYCILGVPNVIGTISLLKYSTSGRTLAVWSFANVILLIRVIVLFSEDKGEAVNRSFAIRSLPYLAMCGPAIFGIWASYRLNVAYYNKYMIIIEALLFIPLYCLLCVHSKRGNYVWAALMISVCLISGALANPVRMGVDDVKMNPDIQMIGEIVKKDPNAIWLVEDGNHPVGNLPLLAGARTVNCTNIYPDVDRWRRFDSEGIYQECYNRYAAVIQVIRQKQNSEGQKFVWDGALSYTVYLTDSEIKSLGVKYVLSSNDLSNDNMKLYSSNGSYNVFIVE